MDALTGVSSNLLRWANASVFRMTKRRPHTAETLARKLNYLMDKYGYSERDMEQKSGVSAKTINNMRNAKHKSSLENAEKVATVFGLDAWQLIIPDLPNDQVESRGLRATVSNYLAADNDGQAAIDRVAEREALYSATKSGKTSEK